MSGHTNETEQHFQTRNLDQDMKDAHKEIFSDPVAHARRLKEERYAIIGALFLAICIFCVVFIIL